PGDRPLQKFSIKTARGSSKRLRTFYSAVRQIMKHTFIKLFRGLHRADRLQPIRFGQDWPIEMRPLSLTPARLKPISKDNSIAQTIHERSDQFHRLPAGVS
ncbi:MAG: hypothetical protein L0Z50_02705, partial [Verrucomicrobiales bacterium]|nr:hypothetical protein [Verrucomicrobiales bacterium]